jgi:uncharacterized protein (TIGR02246 family)
MAAAAALFAVVCMAALRKPLRVLEEPAREAEPQARGLDFVVPDDPPGEDLAAAIERTNFESRDALERGDAGAYAQRYAEDSISLPGTGPVVRGRNAIEEAMEDAFRKTRFRGAEWHTIETHVEGSSAFEIGAYRFLIDNGTTRARALTGRYFVLWKKIGYAWKIAVDAAQPGAPET